MFFKLFKTMVVPSFFLEVKKTIRQGSSEMIIFLDFFVLLYSRVYDVESGELYATFEHSVGQNCSDVVFTRDAGILCGVRKNKIVLKILYSVE